MPCGRDFSVENRLHNTTHNLIDTKAIPEMTRGTTPVLYTSGQIFDIAISIDFEPKTDNVILTNNITEDINFIYYC